MEAARGPKPLAVVERMFVTSYVPLCDAFARGIAGPEAKKTLDTWSASFEQSYREAFDALRGRAVGIDARALREALSCPGRPLRGPRREAGPGLAAPGLSRCSGGRRLRR